jgi:hypothetical protein
MSKFNHMFDIAFSLDSDSEDASDVTPAMLRDALLRRIADLDLTVEVHAPSGETLWLEACSLCDTYAYGLDLEEDVYANACDDENCECRKSASWPDNIRNGCAERNAAREAAESRWHHHDAADTLDLY